MLYSFNATFENISTTTFNDMKYNLLVIITALVFASLVSVNSQNNCTFGECINGYGEYIYENNDIYYGGFINGKRTGYGFYKWAATGSYYKGYWLNDKMNGTGTKYDKDGNILNDGFVFENTFQIVDTTKTKSFRQGITTDGFGMIYKNGTYQVCTHKEGRPVGLSLITSKQNVYFGNYQNGFIGYGIIYYGNGTTYYGNIEGWIPKGKGMMWYNDETTFEGEFDKAYAKGRKFDKQGLLEQIQTWTNGVLTADNSISAQSDVNLAKGLAYVVSTEFDDLMGEAIDNFMYIQYKSKYNLPGAAYSELTGDLMVTDFEAHINASDLSKTQAMLLYNSWIQKLRICLSTSWTGTENEIRDTDNAVFRRYFFTSEEHNFHFELSCWHNDLSVIIHDPKFHKP